MKKLEVKAIAEYKGHSIKENGNINLSIRLQYSELVNTVQMMQMLNNDVTLMAKMPEQKAMKIGTFRINGFTIDGDGESSVKFVSMVDFVDMENINNMITKEPFNIRMVANVEEEDDE